MQSQARLPRTYGRRTQNGSYHLSELDCAIPNLRFMAFRLTHALPSPFLSLVSLVEMMTTPVLSLTKIMQIPSALDWGQLKFDPRAGVRTTRALRAQHPRNSSLRKRISSHALRDLGVELVPERRRRVYDLAIVLYSTRPSLTPLCINNHPPLSVAMSTSTHPYTPRACLCTIATPALASCLSLRTLYYIYDCLCVLMLTPPHV